MYDNNKYIGLLNHEQYSILHYCSRTDLNKIMSAVFVNLIFFGFQRIPPFRFYYMHIRYELYGQLRNNS